MRILVTGGGGFLGRAICRLLRARADQVLSLARSHHVELEPLGVEQVLGDVTSLDSVLEASRGCDAVIHCAAKAGAWGRFDDYYATNVGGTDHVIAACAMNAIPRLVHTSSPSVVHAGRDLEGVDESAPYAAHYSAHYPHTKALAEQHALAANSPTLATVALRPHLIWGPGDPHLLPRLLARARAGRLRFVGEPGKRIDTIYVDNAAQAHLDALDRLEPGAACAGRAYFLSQGQPAPVERVINDLLAACGVSAQSRRVSLRFARAAGAVLEAVYGTLRLEAEPPITRFIAEQLGTAHWFDISAARRDLGYTPRVSTDEGLARLAEWWLREGARA